jgi:hypothetical protein
LNTVQTPGFAVEAYFVDVIRLLACTALASRRGDALVAGEAAALVAGVRRAPMWATAAAAGEIGIGSFVA